MRVDGNYFVTQIYILFLADYFIDLCTRFIEVFKSLIKLSNHGSAAFQEKICRD